MSQRNVYHPIGYLQEDEYDWLFLGPQKDLTPDPRVCFCTRLLLDFHVHFLQTTHAYAALAPTHFNGSYVWRTLCSHHSVIPYARSDTRSERERDNSETEQIRLTIYYL